MIFTHSRYTHTNLYNRGQDTILKKREYANFSSNGSYVIWDESSTLDGLANEYYGDSQLWWVIADANIDIHDPFNIPCGSKIIIPDREEVLRNYGR